MVYRTALCVSELIPPAGRHGTACVAARKDTHPFRPRNAAGDIVRIELAATAARPAAGERETGWCGAREGVPTPGGECPATGDVDNKGGP